MLVLGSLLAGCSLLGVLYNRLDSLVGFYIGDLVTLTPAQSAQLERTLAGNLEWHRESELQHYAGFLREMAVVLDSETRLDRERLLAASGRIEGYWRAIFLQAAPGYTGLALTFSDAQVDEFIAGLEREDAKEYAKFAGRGSAGRDAEREKSLRRTLERFTGPMNERQRALLRDHVRRSPSIGDDWRLSRSRWRDALALALRNRADTPEFRARMLQLIARPDDLWTAQYRRDVDDAREAFIALLLSLDATLTPTQRMAARRELLSLATAVEKLVQA